ncbi:MAG: FAD-binding oxidoreductase [Pseudomonadota bacterium]
MSACISSSVTAELLNSIATIVGPANIKTDAPFLRSGSRDCFHFSPVLIPQLENCQADAIVYPADEQELVKVIATAVAARVPIIPRGGGTGNYGQGVPMQGGLLINTRRMNRIFTLNSDIAHVAAGVNLWTIEKEAAAFGAELRMFPSTIRTSSAAGFITGGSGGVGSVHWGMLRDRDNIRHARAVTIEAEPRCLDLASADELRDVLHNCGLTAFVSEVTFALAPKTQWQQYIYAFDDFGTALAWGEQLANDDSLLKRLTTVFEWPIPSYFTPLVKRDGCPPGKALLFLMTDLQPAAMQLIMTDSGAQLSFHQAPDADDNARGFQIYDFTWNHTTQWAMKYDSGLTYLQDMFDRNKLASQLQARRERFGDQVTTHIEFIRGGDGVVRPGGLSIVRYQGKEQLWDLIQWCEANGIRIANPHTHYLDDDIRWFGDNMLAAKKRWDPHQLLNPGHLHALEAGSA